MSQFRSGTTEVVAPDGQVSDSFSTYSYTYITRTTHAHDASRRAVSVRMCALHMWVGHVERMSEISQSSRTTTVESNMKSEHNLYLACEDSQQRAFFFCTFSCSLIALALSFYCTLTLLLSLSQCRQLSAVFNTRLRKTRTLRRTSRVVLPVLHRQEAPFFPVFHH